MPSAQQTWSAWHVVSATHAPARQTSSSQSLGSRRPQGAPSGSGGFEQPEVVLHASAVQGFPSSQRFALVDWQTPLEQRSPRLHALPSEQVVPSGAEPVVVHAPAMHRSVVHALPSSQARGAPARQVPPLHASPVVHASPSEQGAVLKAWVQVEPVQVAVVQGFPSSTQVGVRVHVSPTQLAVSQPTAKHVAALHPLGYWQPVTGLHIPPAVAVQSVLLGVWAQPSPRQVSVVQATPSSHGLAVPGVSTPATQRSPMVHAFPSS